MAPPVKKRPNPARQIQDRTFVRAQRAASEAASRAGSVISTDRNRSVAPSSVGGSPPPRGPIRKCRNPTCTGTRVGPEGVCINCGTVVHEDSNIVNEVGFSETAGGAAYVTGVNVGFNESGPRMAMTIGNRQIAGNGGGRNNAQTLEQGKLVLATIALKCGREAVPQQIEEIGFNTFGKVQHQGWIRGRTIDRVAAACLYYAVRHSEFTGVMLIDIADAINTDVFVLGRVFKQLLQKLHGEDDGTGTGKIVIKNCPFTTLYPEDIIRILAVRLGFDHGTEKVRHDAVRILQRMDRDWIVSGRKPAGICGAALVIAARMNNFRRTVIEVCYAAKVGESTVLLRLEEFTRVGSARLTVSDFIEKPFTEEAHDPPAFYRQSKEYLAEQDMKKAEKVARAEKAAARKRKRQGPAADDDDENLENGELEVANSRKKQRKGKGRATTSPQPRIDADGFAIPAVPNANATTASKPTEANTAEEDLTEAVPLDEADEQLALASKYGDVPVPGAKEIRKNRLQGSSVREPECDEKDKMTPAEEESLKLILEQINDPESKIYQAAAAYAKIQKETLMAALQSTRPLQYHNEDDLSKVELDDDEFKDDPEVMNCLLGEEERKIKEMVWLNDNKQWLRDQQEKAFKAKTAPPKKSRRKHVRKPRIGEGQLNPAASPEEAAREALERRQISTRLVYSAMRKVFSKETRKGPGSAAASAETSAQPSRVGSPEEEESEEEEWEEDGNADVEVELVDFDEQAVEDDGEEFGGGYDGDDN